LSAGSDPLPIRKGWSLRWKLIFGSAIVEIFMLTLLVVNSVRLIETSLTEQAELRQKEVSVLLNASLAPLLAAQDYGPILDIFASSSREQGIVYFSLWDNRGRLVALDGWSNGTPLPKPSNYFSVSSDQLRFDTEMPIKIGDQKYGDLQYGISTKFLIEARDKLIRQSAMIAVVEVTLSIILLVLLGIWLTRHLKTLEEASRSVSAGDYGVRLNVKSGDEIGRLSDAFNSMAQKISSQIEAVRESEERFRSLAGLSSDWYWEQDAEFRFTRFAGGAFRDFPDLAGGLIGKTRWDSGLVVMNDAEWVEHRAILAAHKPFRDVEYQAVLSSDGHRGYFSINGEPVFAKDGEFLGYRGTGKEITQRKLAELALQESEQKFSSIFQLSPLPLALTDMASGKLADVNEAWSALFGLSRDVVLTQSLADLNLFEKIQEREDFESVISHYGRCELIEVHLHSKAQGALNCELSGRSLHLNDGEFFLWSVRDVTEQRRIEWQIVELNTKLEVRVAERTKELESAIETLHRAQDELVHSEKLAALGRVVAGVAHELNTPIGNSVLVATSLGSKAQAMASLVEGGTMRRSELTAYVSACLEGTSMLEHNLGRAHHLIQSFKQVAVDQTSDRRREFDLKIMLEEIAITLQPLLRNTEHPLLLDIPEGIVMNSYPGPLGQIINNFVNNALLHGFDGRAQGGMSIVARLAADAAVEICFSDTGNGMAPEHLKRIFDPFFTTRLGQGGSGLGLNIVYNQVTHILGGSVQVSSELGKGTQFTLLLPLIAPEHAEASI
jgi:PAS domain S-box-containing protein